MRHCPSIGLGLGLSLRSTGFGVSYTREGRVLDYSTGVGPFTIVDQSGEGNTATLYSGRGLTIDAGSNTVVYDTNYTSASRTAAVWMRVSGLGARTLNGATGAFTFTPTATNTWEQLSSTATVTGDLTWTAGSNCDIGDLTCATEHWTHNDWSDPAGDTSNGKAIVDSGPNQLHGTCTGCSGFTGEATIPQTADRNWNNLAGQMVSASDANDQIDAYGTAISEPRLNTQQLNLFGEGEYSRTPDSASLDLTTAATWELWGNFYGDYSSGDAYILNKGIAFSFWKNDTQLIDELTFVVAGEARKMDIVDSIICVTIVYKGSVPSIEAYVNGSVVSTVILAGTLNSSIDVTSDPVTIGAVSTSIAAPYNKKIGSAKIYNVALTAAEVLTNYETQKSLYGL